MKWNGRSYRPPGYGIKIYPTKQDSIAELLKPLGEKERKGNVWIPVLNQPINVLKQTQAPVITPSVTPTQTGTGTPTPTPTGTPTQTPTQTGTGTPTPTPTGTSTPTPSPSTPADAVISYRTWVEDSSITSCNFGTAGLVCVMVQSENNNNSSISSVVIDGITATQARLDIYNSLLVQAIYYAVVTGSTGNIQVNYTNTQLRSGIAVWTITSYSSTTPTYTYGITVGVSTSLSQITPSLPAGSVGIAGWNNTVNAARNVTWTNATERFDVDYSASTGEGSGADFTQATAGTRDVQISGLGNTGGNVFQIVTWR
jgi:hypothetical protein